ncbi:hypothetical protein, partial [Microbispora triticiradicis]|uniref:hypothetical protein n=1 Tax=Microbispora triticiradicis TaxID=2200763 RepID=UPI001ABF248D
MLTMARCGRQRSRVRIFQVYKVATAARSSRPRGSRPQLRQDNPAHRPSGSPGRPGDLGAARRLRGLS